MDRVMVQVRFRKGIFKCKCGQEDVVDFNVAGGNTYENNCSKCGAWSNSFVNYDGCATFTKEDYDKKVSADIEKTKSDLFTSWDYTRKNPPAYVEPSKEDLEREKAEYEAKVVELDTRISEKTLAESR